MTFTDQLSVCIQRGKTKIQRPDNIVICTRSAHYCCLMKCPMNARHMGDPCKFEAEHPGYKLIGNTVIYGGNNG